MEYIWHTVVHLELDRVFGEFLHFGIKLSSRLLSFGDNPINILVSDSAILGAENHLCAEPHHLEQFILVHSWSLHKKINES